MFRRALMSASSQRPGSDMIGVFGCFRRMTDLGNLLLVRWSNTLTGGAPDAPSNFPIGSVRRLARLDHHISHRIGNPILTSLCQVISRPMRSWESAPCPTSSDWRADSQDRMDHQGIVAGFGHAGVNAFATTRVAAATGLEGEGPFGEIEPGSPHQRVRVVSGAAARDPRPQVHFTRRLRPRRCPDRCLHGAG